MSLFCNGEHFRWWESENCDRCARFDNNALDCGCDLAYAIQLSAGCDQLTDEMAKRLGFESAKTTSYINHFCPEFLPIGSEIQPQIVIDPNQMDLPL